MLLLIVLLVELDIFVIRKELETNRTFYVHLGTIVLKHRQQMQQWSNVQQVLIEIL